MAATTGTRLGTPMVQLWAPRMLSVLRFVTGLMFMEHGMSKLFGIPAPFPGGGPAPFTLLWVAGILETFGGLLVALGLFTRPAAFVLSGEMAIGYWMIHAPKSLFPLLNGGDAAVLYCFVFLYLFVAGGGVWSVDRFLRR